MKDNLNKKPKLTKSIVYKDKSIDGKGKYLVFDYSTALGFLTNKLGIQIISRCDGRKNILLILGELFKLYLDVPKEQIRTDVLDFLREMEENGIIET